jgi:hypothetical protein
MNPLTLTAPRIKRWVRVATSFLLGCYWAALCFVALAFDQTAGSDASWRHWCGFIVVGAGISAILCMRYGLRIALCAAGGFLVSVLVLQYCNETPAKAFRRLDAAIHNGMTLADVRSAVQREFPERGRFPVPTLLESALATQMGGEVFSFGSQRDLDLFIDSRFGFNMLVSFRNGRVTDKQPNLEPGSDRALPTSAALVAAFGCFLYLWSARRVAAVKPWIGQGIDAASVAQRIQCVRRTILERVACGTMWPASAGVCWHRPGWPFDGFPTFATGQLVLKSGKMNQRSLPPASVVSH